jgi:hypothetical protein
MGQHPTADAGLRADIHTVADPDSRETSTPGPMHAVGAIDALASTRAPASTPGGGSTGRSEPGSSAATVSMNAARTSSTRMKV